MIGLCCQFLEQKISAKGKISYKNIFEENSLQYNRFLSGKYPQKQILAVWLNNISKLQENLPKIFNLGIKSFRLSSNYFPLFDKLDNQLENNQEIKDILADIGNFINKNQIRVTCHPSQFVVLSSKNPEVIKNSVINLAHHAWIMDCMGLGYTPYNAINIHGGAKGELKTLIEQTNVLPDNIKSRLTFENDEKCYNVDNLYTVYQETGIPIVFDAHHYSFNKGNLNEEEAYQKSISTWKCKPLTHLSNTEPELKNGSFTERRKHSEYVYYIPEYLIRDNNLNQIDIDFEFKMKNLAIFKAVKDFNILL
jgi:UV DNA damage endonuclease